MTTDVRKTKAMLIQELNALRQRLARSEKKRGKIDPAVAVRAGVHGPGPAASRSGNRLDASGDRPAEDESHVITTTPSMVPGRARGARNHLNKILLDSMPYICLLLRPKTREIVAANKAALTVGALPGTRCYVSWARGGKPCPWCKAPALWRTGRPQQTVAEFGGRTLEGHWIPVNRDLYMHYAIDITHLVKAERAMRESKELFERTVQSLREAVLLLDADSLRITDCNQEASRMFGYPRHEILGRTSEALHVDRSSRERFLKTLYAQFHERGYLDGFEFHMKRRDGRVFPTEHSVVPLMNSQGKPGTWISVVRDISDRKQAEEQLQKKHGELAHALRLATMGEMAAGLAHELNQPLASIVNYAGACVRGTKTASLSPDEILAALEQIVQQAETSGARIRRIRDFVRKTEPKRASVNLNDAVRIAANLVEPKMKHLGIDLQLRLQEGIPLIRSDPIQIEQVILNLMQNAVDAVSEVDLDSRKIRIETRTEEDNSLTFRIRDRGKGLPNDLQSRIFEPFFSTKPDGLGMGLPISRGIIENHGGRIGCDPNPDGGMTFYFVLPCVAK